MKTYGIVLVALTVMFLGAKFLHAGWNGNAQPKTDSMSQETNSQASERELVLRWQQNHANHWRGYMMQQQ